MHQTKTSIKSSVIKPELRAQIKLSLEQPRISHVQALTILKEEQTSSTTFIALPVFRERIVSVPFPVSPSIKVQNYQTTSHSTKPKLQLSHPPKTSITKSSPPFYGQNYALLSFYLIKPIILQPQPSHAQTLTF